MAEDGGDGADTDHNVGEMRGLWGGTQQAGQGSRLGVAGKGSPLHEAGKGD